MDLRKGAPIMTYSGILFYPLDPRPEEIILDDIVHQLAGINRYNGAASIPFSVAMHSIIGARLCLSYWPGDYETAFRFILHDAAETYTQDMIRPVKINIPELKKIENKISDMIARKFNLDGPLMTDKVTEIDNNLLRTEFTFLMPWVPDTVAGKHLPYLGPAIFKMASMGFESVKAQYLELFNELQEKCFSLDMDMAAINER